MDWKKEYKVSDLFRREAGAEGSGEQPSERPAPPATEGSMWKKELKLSSFFRRKKEPRQRALPQIGDTVAEGTMPPGPVEPAQPEPSVWKKEIKLSTLFRRKREQRQPRRQLALPAPGDTLAEAPTGPAGEPPAAPEPAPAPPAEPPATVAEAPAAAAETVTAEQPEPPVEHEPVPPASASAPEQPYASEPEPAPEAVEPVPAEAPAAEAVEAPAVEPEPVAGSEPAVEAEPAVQPEPTVEAEPAVEPEAAAEPETVPAPVEEPAPIAEEPAAPAEPPATAPKQPFWKKEIGRKSGDKQPKRAKSERRARQKPPKAERGAQPASGRQAPARKSKGGQLPQVPLMKALNLLPQDIKLPKTTVRPWVAYAAVGAAALLVAGGMGFLYLNERNRLAERESTLEDMDSQLAALEAAAAQAQAASVDGSALAGEAQTRATALAFALDSRRGWDRILRELSLTLPDNVWFSSMVSTSSVPVPVLPTDPAAAAAAAPVAPVPATSMLTITGYALTQEDVAQLLARLEVVPEFNAIQLESATQTEIGEQSVIEFSVIGSLKQPIQVTP